MADLVRYFAGKDRSFRLHTGEILDIEEACGKVGIGSIYIRIARHEFFLKDVTSIVRIGLIGAGEKPAEAQRLVDDRVKDGLVQLQELALDLMIAVWEGMPKDTLSSSGDPDKPHEVGKILHSFIQAGISPDQVRKMSYSDFANIMLAAGGKDVQPPSEKEFEQMLKEFEAQHGK